ncbi:MAG: YdcF family protein [Pleurocapsa sp. MO_226.B13]|nr:YdcF family protein [Pleurocapsa sp. MO_226.B13]
MSKKRTKLWGLFSYRLRWGLSIRGWLVILGAIAVAFWLLLFKLESFLAYSKPVDADILVVEGWIADDGIIGAIAEFERKPYELLITAGSNFGRGEYLSQYKNFAYLSQATLVTLGVDPQKIQPVPTPPAEKDRTLTSAIEVKKWLEQNQLTPKGINVYTIDVHSRRTWLLYKRVFAPKIPVGVISHPPLDYEPQTWWTSSEGFRKVFSETLAYIYAKFL